MAVVVIGVSSPVAGSSAAAARWWSIGSGFVVSCGATWHRARYGRDLRYVMQNDCPQSTHIEPELAELIVDLGETAVALLLDQVPQLIDRLLDGERDIVVEREVRRGV